MNMTMRIAALSMLAIWLAAFCGCNDNSSESQQDNVDLDTAQQSEETTSEDVAVTEEPASKSEIKLDSSEGLDGINLGMDADFLETLYDGVDGIETVLKWFLVDDMAQFIITYPQGSGITHYAYLADESVVQVNKSMPLDEGEFQQQVDVFFAEYGDPVDDLPDFAKDLSYFRNFDEDKDKFGKNHFWSIEGGNALANAVTVPDSGQMHFMLIDVDGYKLIEDKMQRIEEDRAKAQQEAFDLNGDGIVTPEEMEEVNRRMNKGN